MEFVSLPTSGELVDPAKQKFWRWEQKKKTTLVTSSGNLGSDGRESSKKFPTADKVEKDIESKHYAKLKNGFRQLSNKANLPLLWQTWLTDSYTGFLSMDINLEQNLAAFCRHTGNSKNRCEVVLLDLESGDEKQVIKLNEFDLFKLQFHHENLIIQFDDRIMKLNTKTGKTSSITDSGLFPFFLFDYRAIEFSTRPKIAKRIIWSFKT